MPCQKTYNSCGTNCCNKPRSSKKKRDQAIQFGNISLPVPYTEDDDESDSKSSKCDGDEDDNLGEPVKLALVNRPAKASCSDCSVQILVDYCKKGKTRTCKCDQGPKRIRPQTLKSFKSNCSVCGIPFNIKRNASQYHKDCVESNPPCGIKSKRNSSHCSCNKPESRHGENSREVLIRKYNYTIPCQRRSNTAIAPKTCIPKMIPNRVLIDCSNKNCKNASTFTEDCEEDEDAKSSSCNCSSSEDESSGSQGKPKSKEDIKKEKKEKKEAEKKKKEREKKKKKERQKKEKERKKREKEKKKEKDRDRSSKSSRSESRSSVCCSDDGGNDDRDNDKKKDKQKKKDKKSKDKNKDNKKSQSTQKIEIIFDDDEKRWKDANKYQRSKRRSDDDFSYSSRTSSTCSSRGSQKGKKDNKKDKNKAKKKDKKKAKKKSSEEKHSQTKVRDKCCSRSSKPNKQSCKVNRLKTRSIKSSGNICCQDDNNIRASAYYGRNVPFGCGIADEKQSCYLLSQQSYTNVKAEPVCHHLTNCDQKACHATSCDKMPLTSPPCYDPGNQDTSCYQKLPPPICNNSRSNIGCSKFNTNYGLCPVEYGRKFDDLCKKQLMISLGKCTLVSDSVDNCETLAQMANSCPVQNTNNCETYVQMGNPCPPGNYCWEIPTENCGTCVQLDNACPNPVNDCWDKPKDNYCDSGVQFNGTCSQNRQMGNDC